MSSRCLNGKQYFIDLAKDVNKILDYHKTRNTCVLPRKITHLTRASFMSLTNNVCFYKGSSGFYKGSSLMWKVEYNIDEDLPEFF